MNVYSCPVKKATAISAKLIIFLPPGTNMSTLKDLIAQREAIEKQITELRQTEIADSIAKIRALIAEHGLTQSDIFGDVAKVRKAKGSGTKVAAKYRDPISGKEWSGRGLAPKWLQGKDKSAYLIA